MSSAAGTESRTLVDRAKAILMKPKEEWPVIAAEKTEIAALYRTYVIPLAAIGPVANAIGGAPLRANPLRPGAGPRPLTHPGLRARLSFAPSPPRTSTP